jgi:hypothetical protein
MIFPFNLGYQFIPVCWTCFVGLSEPGKDLNYAGQFSSATARSEFIRVVAVVIAKGKRFMINTTI